MVEPLIEWLRGFGELSLVSGAVLALVFFCASFVPFPRTFLYLGVGGLYGMTSMPIVFTASILGGACAFLTARYLAAEPLRRRLDRNPQLAAITQAIDSEGWRIVALCRLGSPLPNAVQNYSFGLTRIGFWTHTVTTIVFSLPQTLLYLYIGAVGRSMLLEDSSSPLSRIVMLVGAACFGTVIFVVWRKARAALAAMPAPL